MSTREAYSSWDDDVVMNGTPSPASSSSSSFSSSASAPSLRDYIIVPDDGNLGRTPAGSVPMSDSAAAEAAYNYSDDEGPNDDNLQTVSGAAAPAATEQIQAAANNETIAEGPSASTTAPGSESGLRVQNYTSIVFRTAQKIKEIAEKISQHLKKGKLKVNLSTEDIRRLNFLKETIELIIVYITNQNPNTQADTDYQHLLASLLLALQQSEQMVVEIAAGSSTMTENFEIFELVLRRYLEQLKRMFPHERNAIPQPASSLIEDRKARIVWEDRFGSHCRWVTWETFVSKVIDTEWALAVAECPEFVKFLRYFINFPEDNTITTYKFNLLTRLFGPWDLFPTTFSTMLCRAGFLGLINRIRAEEILKQDGRKQRLLLVRFSRTEPEYLAFSYLDEQGEMRHTLNRKPKSTKIISCGRYIRENFAGFEMVSQRVKVDAVLNICMNQLDRASDASASSPRRTWDLYNYAIVGSAIGYLEPAKKR